MKSVHFVGVGGIGMSGLAKILLQRGKIVSGSDLKNSPILEELRSSGASIYLGHQSENVSSPDCIVVSSDIPKGNPEIDKAQSLNIPIIHRSDLLKILAQEQAIVAISGTHGKTTTSSLLAHVAEFSKCNPGYAVGGIIKSTRSNAKHGSGKHFILEADESDGTFLKYPYSLAVVTNVDSDHIVHYGSMDGVRNAFREFILKSPNPESILVCGEDPFLATFKGQATLYGFHEGCSLQASCVRYERRGTILNISFKGKLYKDVESPLFGKHNVLNALSVFGLALLMGIPEDRIRSSFKSFSGVNRRLDLKGRARDLLVFDDYGHHPTEIQATLQALRQRVGGRKVTAVFQPHRYSRMQYIMNDFSDAFEEADEIVITDLFTAGEAPIPGVSTHDIVKAVESAQKVSTHYIPRASLVSELNKRLRPHEAVIFFGAGDSTQAAGELAALSESSLQKLQIGLVCGGENSEHKISKISARSVFEHLNRDLYDLQVFEISSTGSWVKRENVSKDSNHEESGNTRISPAVLQSLYECDCYIPILHGPRGEDGTIQGFFEMLGKPYVGCSVVSASCSMDKVKTKRLAMSLGVPVVPFVEVRAEDWMRRCESSINEIINTLTFPLIVKPSHLGSSVGIEKVEDIKALISALDKACLIDRQVIVEECITIAHELECAVLGNEDASTTSPGEICSDGKIYDYAAKYGSSCFKTNLKPEISPEIRSQVEQLALLSYRAVDCRGMARVDMFQDEKGNVFLNEVNPIPGFTSISLYPSLWKNNGKNYPELLQDLILLALEQYWNEKRTFIRQIHLGKVLEKSCAV